MSAPSRGGLSAQFAAIPVTCWLIAANLAMYVVSAVQAGSVLNNQRSTLFLNTTLYPPLVAAQDQWWRVLTSAFDHFGPVHLALNMYMLWLLGLGVERSVGHARFLGTYLLSAVGGSAAAMAFDTYRNTAGASGAIFGLLGAYAVVALALRVDAKGVLMLIGLNVVVSVVVPGISWAAHLGGLLGGVAVALATVVLPRVLPASVGPGMRVATERIGWGSAAVVICAAAYLAAEGTGF